MRVSSTAPCRVDLACAQDDYPAMYSGISSIERTPAGIVRIHRNFDRTAAVANATRDALACAGPLGRGDVAPIGVQVG